jgi:hypothetical protein
MKPLEQIEMELRSAVESRRYREVERLVVAYCEAARTYVGSLAPGGPELPEAQKAVQEVLEWTSRMLLAGRASIALELNRLPRVQRYLQTPPAGGRSWHVEG